MGIEPSIHGILSKNVKIIYVTSDKLIIFSRESFEYLQEVNMIFIMEEIIQRAVTISSTASKNQYFSII